MPRRREQPPRRPPDQPPTQPEFVPSPWPLARILSETRNKERVETDTEAKETSSEPAVFEQFISSLKKELLQPAHTSMAGVSFEWKQFPLEEALADGLWVILLKAAERGNRSLSTEKDVSESAKITNYFIETGLLFRYQTMEDAAKGFLEHVEKAISTELARRPVGAGFVAADLWRGPVAEFLASLIRTVRDIGQEVETIKAVIEKTNTASQARRVTFAHIPYLNTTELSPASFDIVSAWASGRAPYAGQPKRVRDEVNELRAYPSRIQVCKRFGAKIQTIPEDVYTGDTSIEEEWVKTQLCLASIDAPERDYLTQDELARALPAIKVLTEADAVDRFNKRMLVRNPGFIATPESNDLVLSAKKTLNETHNWVDNDTAFAVYVQFDLDTITAFGHEEALEYATANGRRGAYTSLVKRLGKDQVTGLIVEAIQWEALEAGAFEDIVEKGVLPLQSLIVGIQRMKKKKQLDAADTLLFFHEDEKTVREALEKAGLLRERGGGDEKLALVRDSEIEETIIRIFENKGEFKHTDPDAEGQYLVAELLARADQDTLRRLFDNPKIRQRLILHYDGIFKSNSIDSAEKKILLKEKLGKDGMIRWLLADELNARFQLDYPGKHKDDYLGEKNLPPWESIDTSPGVGEQIEELGINPKDIKEFVSRHSEEDLVRWTYEADADVEDMVKRYKKHRDAYYGKKKSRKKK